MLGVFLACFGSCVCSMLWQLYLKDALAVVFAVCFGSFMCSMLGHLIWRLCVAMLENNSLADVFLVCVV